MKTLTTDQRFSLTTVHLFNRRVEEGFNKGQWFFGNVTAACGPLGIPGRYVYQ